jgi:hypothetical protein
MDAPGERHTSGMELLVRRVIDRSVHAPTSDRVAFRAPRRAGACSVEREVAAGSTTSAAGTSRGVCHGFARPVIRRSEPWAVVGSRCIEGGDTHRAHRQIPALPYGLRHPPAFSATTLGVLRITPRDAAHGRWPGESEHVAAVRGRAPREGGVGSSRLRQGHGQADHDASHSRKRRGSTAALGASMNSSPTGGVDR